MSKVDGEVDAIHFEITQVCVPWLEDAETIVFHHGVGACSGVWSGWIPALVDRYRLVRFDMRGHGRSPVPARWHWSLDALVEDLASVADAADASQFHLIGESIGGTVALAFAARHPDRVLSLTVCNGAHAGGAIENLAPWKTIIEKEGMRAWSAHMMQQRFVDGTVTGRRLHWYEAQQATADADAVLEAAKVLSNADLTEELPHITMPVLLMHPDTSPFIPLHVMANLKSHLPNARLMVFPNARHGLPFSHARECAKTLRDFLTE